MIVLVGPPAAFEKESKAAAVTAAGTGNNFNALRLAFALMVVAYHLTVLPGIAGWSGFEQALGLGAEIGVQGFFVLSGYLVYGSLVRSGSARLYAEKRVRRLYPAYAFVVTACAIAALIVSAETRSDPAGVFRYFLANITFLNFLEPNLPGVFEDNRFTEVNGALWTLKIEVLFYIVLPILAWLLHRIGRFQWIALAAIYVAAEVWRGGLEQAGLREPDTPWLELSRQLPGQMSFFVTGIAFALIRLSRRDLNLIGLGAAVLLALSLLVPLAEPLRALGLGGVSVWAAKGAGRLPDAARFGDLSYGLYILHFPIIQTVIALGLFRAPAIGIGLSITTALAGALLLWRYVERPALRSDSAYRSAH